MMRLLKNLFYPVFAVFRSLLNPMRWIELPRRLGRLSPPALAALATFLLLMIGLLWLYLITLGDDYLLLSPVGWLAFFLLSVVITAAVYYAVYLYLLPECDAFDDIQLAWEKGVAEMERLGIDLYERPLFLILGVETPQRVGQLLRASGLDFAVDAFPAGHAALHWYAGDEAVFVVCNEIGCLTSIAQKALLGLKAGISPAPAAREAVPLDLNRTFWPTQAPEALDGRPEASSPAAGAPASPPAGPREDAGPLNLGMTMEAPIADFLLDRTESGEAKHRPQDVRQRLVLEGVVEEQLPRIEYLCHLIRDARSPRAPVNGILTVLPLNMILCDASEGADIQEAARQDLLTLVHFLRERCPTYAVVSGWEDDPGFLELVRRLPGDKKHSRFGKGNRPGDPPTPDRLEAVARNATAAFEDWIYYLYKQPAALSKPGNRQLYSLLCKVRRYLNSPLVKIIADGYSSHENEPGGEFFGGCYFVAAGGDDSRQAFVRGVFYKIQEQHKQLQWTSAALRADKTYRWAAYVGFATAVGLLMAAIVMAHRLLFQNAL
jgi:hypothetical protein